MLRCRKGDIAYIMMGPHVGKIVNVIRFLGDDDAESEGGAVRVYENLWEITPPRGALVRSDAVCVFPDSGLLPIRPDELREEEEKERELVE